MEKEVHFKTWTELLKAIPRYEKLGYACEVRGWDAMSKNILTIMDVLNPHKKGESE